MDILSVSFVNWCGWNNDVFNSKRKSNNISWKYRHHRALLVMDGHGSRAYPLASYLLKCNSIDFLILPVHPTPITQMFDVCLAHPFKQLAGKIMKKLLKDHINDKDIPRFCIIRKCAINAVVSAWISIFVIQWIAKKQHWKRVFLYMILNKLINQNSLSFVLKKKINTFKKRCERSRLDINSKIIITDSFIVEVIERISVHPKFQQPSVKWCNLDFNYW